VNDQFGEPDHGQTQGYRGVERRAGTGAGQTRTPHRRIAIDFAGLDHIVAGSDYPHQIGSIPKMIETVGPNADIYAANARRLLKLP